MNASLPDFQPAVVRSGAVAAGSTNNPVVQQDSESPQGFMPILEQATAEASGPLSVDGGISPEVENLFRDLQMLPEGGKLLPQLQQMLDDAAAAGIEPDQVLQQIAGSVRQLQSEQSISAAEGLVAVLPAYRNNTSLPTGMTGLAAATASSGDLLPSAALVRSQQGALARGDSWALPATRALADNAQPGAPVSNPDKSAFVLPTTVTDQVQPEQTVLAAALRQFTRMQQSSAADTPLRTEPVSVALANQLQTAGPAPAAAMPPVIGVNHSLNQPGWDQAFGEKVQWMMRQGIQGAQIRLNPAQLGPMEVNIQVRNDQASIQFSSAHAPVREALEAAIPRLRDMMESSGVELVDVDISGQSFAERQTTSSQEQMARSRFTAGDAPEAENIIETSVAALVSAGRLDLFA